MISHSLGNEHVYDDFPVYKGRNLIGTDEICDIVMPYQPHIAPVHGVLRTGEQLFYTDCETDEGSFLNGQRVYREILSDRDRLRIGKILEFSFQSATES